MTKMKGKVVSLVSCLALTVMMLAALAVTGVSAAVIPSEDPLTASIGTPAGIDDPAWDEVPAQALDWVINESWGYKKVYTEAKEEHPEDVVSKASFQVMADGENVYLRLKAEDPYVCQDTSYAAGASSWTYEGFWFSPLGEIFGDGPAFRWTDLSRYGITKTIQDEDWGYYELLTFSYETAELESTGGSIQMSVYYNDWLEEVHDSSVFGPASNSGRNYSLYANPSGSKFGVTIPDATAATETTETTGSTEATGTTETTGTTEAPAEPELDKTMKIGTPSGYDDPIWDQVSSIPLDYYRTNDNSIQGPIDSDSAVENGVDVRVSYKVMYDDTYIYYLYDVTDSNYQTMGGYCSAGRDWSKNGIYHVYPQLNSVEASGQLWNLPSRNIYFDGDDHYIAMHKVNRELIGMPADATELQVRVYYNGYYGEDGPLPVTDDGSRNYWLWNSSESPNTGAVTFTLSDEELIPTPTEPTTTAETTAAQTTARTTAPDTEDTTDPGAAQPTGAPTEESLPDVETGENSPVLWIAGLAAAALTVMLALYFRAARKQKS